MTPEQILEWLARRYARAGFNLTPFGDTRPGRASNRMWRILFLALGQTAQPAPKLPEDVQNRVLIMDVLAERCQFGDPGERTWRACELHDAFYKTLNRDGWCYGHNGQREADKEWEPCRESKPKETNRDTFGHMQNGRVV